MSRRVTNRSSLTAERNRDLKHLEEIVQLRARIAELERLGDAMAGDLEGVWSVMEEDGGHIGAEEGSSLARAWRKFRAGEGGGIGALHSPSRFAAFAKEWTEHHPDAADEEKLRAQAEKEQE